MQYVPVSADADLGVSPEDQLHGVGEIELEVEVTRLAVPVLADRPEGVLDLAGEPAGRAEDVPEQGEQAHMGTVQARGHDLVGVEAQAAGQGQRPDPRHLRGRGVGQEIAQTLHNRGVEAATGPGHPGGRRGAVAGIRVARPAPRRDRPRRRHPAGRTGPRRCDGTRGRSPAPPTGACTM